MRVPDQLPADIEKMTQLVAEVRKLRTSNRIMMTLLGVVVVVALLAGATALYARSSADRAHDAVSTAKAVSVALAVEACRARNSANDETRKAFNSFVDAVDKLVMTPEQHAQIAQLRAAIPTAESQDRDCDVPPDGLGPDDYQS